MAFKREGNDGSWLNSLKNRRVAELFAEDIPDGEAHLMKNGRFACMICSHRPVFDTVLMLAKHRDGKKHAANKEIADAEKEDVKLLRLQRQHEDLVKSGQISPALLESKSTTSGVINVKRLLGAAPYDPKHKKVKTQRRKMVDLSASETDNDSVSVTTESPPPAQDTYSWKSKASTVPPAEHNNVGNSSWSTFQMSSKKKCDQHAKSNANGRAVSNKRYNPVNPATGQKLYASSGTVTEKRKPKSQGKQPQTIVDLVKTQQALAEEEHILTNFRPYQRKNPSKTPVSFSVNKPSSHQGTESTIHANSSSSSVSQAASISEKVAEHTERSSSSSSHVQQCVQRDQQPKPVYIEEFRSGYKKDVFGQWIRDSEAEFDSDEDES